MTEDEEKLEAAVKIKASEMLEKYRDAARLAEELAEARNENFKLRGAKRDLDRELKELTGRLPPADALVLTGPAVTEYQALTGLGTCSELQEALAERETLKAAAGRLEVENAAIKRDAVLRDVAGDAGFKFSVLKDRDERTPGLDYVRKTHTVDGKAVPGWHVRFQESPEAAPTEVSLQQYAESHWPDFMPALRVQPAAEPAGTRHIAQGSGGASGAGSLFDRIRREAAETAKVTGQGPVLEDRLHMRPVQ